MDKVHQIPRNVLLEPKEKVPSGNVVSLISTYSPISGVLKKVVYKHWHILNTDPGIGAAFQEPARLFLIKSSLICITFL